MLILGLPNSLLVIAAPKSDAHSHVSNVILSAPQRSSIRIRVFFSDAQRPTYHGQTSPCWISVSTSLMLTFPPMHGVSSEVTLGLSMCLVLFLLKGLLASFDDSLLALRDGDRVLR